VKKEKLASKMMQLVSQGFTRAVVCIVYKQILCDRNGTDSRQIHNSAHIYLVFGACSGSSEYVLGFICFSGRKGKSFGFSRISRFFPLSMCLIPLFFPTKCNTAVFLYT